MKYADFVEVCKTYGDSRLPEADRWKSITALTIDSMARIDVRDLIAHNRFRFIGDGTAATGFLIYDEIPVEFCTYGKKCLTFIDLNAIFSVSFATEDVKIPELISDLDGDVDYILNARAAAAAEEAGDDDFEADPIAINPKFEHSEYTMTVGGEVPEINVLTPGGTGVTNTIRVIKSVDDIFEAEDTDGISFTEANIQALAAGTYYLKLFVSGDYEGTAVAVLTIQ